MFVQGCGTPQPLASALGGRVTRSCGSSVSHVAQEQADPAPAPVSAAKGAPFTKLHKAALPPLLADISPAAKSPSVGSFGGGSSTCSDWKMPPGVITAAVSVMSITSAPHAGRPALA
jgi:hypothetical protein